VRPKSEEHLRSASGGKKKKKKGRPGKKEREARKG
jgi:hypothetical protein